ncbi:pentapeptide repeat-containing protein [Halomonas cupida]
MGPVFPGTVFSRAVFPGAVLSRAVFQNVRFRSP